MYDYGARMYDGAIGRFMRIDPLSFLQESFSPYHYVYNSPINYTDPTGMIGERVNKIASTFVGPDGRIIEHRDDGDNRIFYVANPEEWEENGKKKDGLHMIGLENPNYEYREGSKINLIDKNQNLLAPSSGAVEPDYTFESFAIPFFGWLKYVKFGKWGGKLLWGFWDDYAKVVYKGKKYAKVGNRYYSRHAVDRMSPSGLGSAAGGVSGRSISPNFIEEVITSGSKTTQVVDGVTRTVYTSGSVSVVTEEAGKVVITVMTR
jgi:hypothetical protein